MPTVFNPPPHSIAVLPFVNMSGDKDQDYFSDGLTEELLNDLARINELQVAARTSAFSFRGKEADIATIARKLNVGAVLEGSVRRSGRRIRVTAQLNNAVTGFHIWSQTYDRAVGDALIVQTEIARAVASALKVTLLGDRNARIEVGGTRSGTAFDAYARGLRAYSNAQDDEGLSNAVSAFSEAIKLDPNFALAYAARSIALTSFYNPASETIEKARADAHRAISLAPELAEGYLALSVLLEQELDFPGAYQEVEQALALAPGSVRMLRHYGALSVLMGRTDSGLAAAHRAVLLDPLNFDAYGYLATALLYAHRYGEAIAAFQKTRELSSNPGIPVAAAQGLAYYAEGDYRAAREACETKSEREQDIHRACLAMAYEKLGQHADAQAELTKIKASSGNASAYYCAEVRAQWGNRTEALDCLDSAMRLRNPDLERLKTDPLMDPLRKEPRFQAIERELKFPR
jgi:TolB-like protein